MGDDQGIHTVIVDGRHVRKRENLKFSDAVRQTPDSGITALVGMAGFSDFGVRAIWWGGDTTVLPPRLEGG